MELQNYGDTTKGTTPAAKDAPPPPGPGLLDYPLIRANGASADIPTDPWKQQSQTYIDSGVFPSTIESTETRSPITRARNFGLRNFDSMDRNKDGKISDYDIPNSGFIDGQKDMVGARVMLQNFQLIDSSGDGFIDKNELVATSSDKVKKPYLVPTTISKDHSKGAPEQQAKTTEIIAAQVDSNHSKHDYLDESVKALSGAIVRGDIKAIDAMTKTFTQNPKELDKIVEGAKDALAGSGTGLWEDGGYLTVASLENQVTFSKSDKPQSRNFRVSAEDAIKEIGRKAASGGEGIQEFHHKADLEKVEQRKDAKLLDSLSTELTSADKSVAMRLLERARHNEPALFQDILTRQVAREPQSAYRIGKAMGEITKGQDIDFNMVSVSDESLMQIRNAKGDKALTIAPDHLGRYPLGIIGAERVRPGREGATPRQLMHWVVDSINQGRQKALDNGK